MGNCVSSTDDRVPNFSNIHPQEANESPRSPRKTVTILPSPKLNHSSKYLPTVTPQAAAIGKMAPLPQSPSKYSSASPPSTPTKVIVAPVPPAHQQPYYSPSSPATRTPSSPSIPVPNNPPIIPEAQPLPLVLQKKKASEAQLVRQSSSPRMQIKQTIDVSSSAVGVVAAPVAVVTAVPVKPTNAASGALPTFAQLRLGGKNQPGGPTSATGSSHSAPSSPALVSPVARRAILQQEPADQLADIVRKVGSDSNLFGGNVDVKQTNETVRELQLVRTQSSLTRLHVSTTVNVTPSGVGEPLTMSPLPLLRKKSSRAFPILKKPSSVSLDSESPESISSAADSERHRAMTDKLILATKEMQISPLVSPTDDRQGSTIGKFPETTTTTLEDLLKTAALPVYSPLSQTDAKPALFPSARTSTNVSSLSSPTSQSGKSDIHVDKVVTVSRPGDMYDQLPFLAPKPVSLRDSPPLTAFNDGRDSLEDSEFEQVAARTLRNLDASFEEQQQQQQHQSQEQQSTGVRESLETSDVETKRIAADSNSVSHYPPQQHPQQSPKSVEMTKTSSQQSLSSGASERNGPVGVAVSSDRTSVASAKRVSVNEPISSAAQRIQSEDVKSSITQPVPVTSAVKSTVSVLKASSAAGSLHRAQSEKVLGSSRLTTTTSGTVTSGSKTVTHSTSGLASTTTAMIDKKSSMPVVELKKTNSERILGTTSGSTGVGLAACDEFQAHAWRPKVCRNCSRSIEDHS